MRGQGGAGEGMAEQPEPWLAALDAVSAREGGGDGAVGGAVAIGRSSEAGPPRLSPRVRAAVGAVVVLGLLGLGAAVVVSLLTPGGAESVVAPGGADSSPEAVEPGGSGAATDPSVVAPPTEAAVIVHVLGAVSRPGIVEVGVGDRVIDAIAAAGGTTDVADVARINLARELVDGEQLYVPALGEEVPAGAGSVGGPGGAAAEGGVGGPGASGLVNLNTADAAALETLPGVGPALATRILAWRDENGPFRAIDELLAVAGIGEKTLAGFRDLVTV